MAVVSDTVEVRWFMTGPPPRVVSDWFLHAPVPAITESRADLYLELADRDDMGVKVRAGTLLELKFRTGVHAELGLAEGFDGRVESWTKWGFALDPPETGTGGGDPRWIQVEKNRRSRLYEVASDKGFTHAVPSMEQTGEGGCAAELVEVRVGDHMAWGIGFEAFGTVSDLRDVLVGGMNAYVADTPLGNLEFRISDSHSYPAFLSFWPPRY